MAGGTDRATTGLPAWLVAANESTRRAAEEAQAQRRPQRRIHCWVHATGADHAGLVLEWRREGAGWMARVVWTTGGGDLVCTWLDAEQIEPV
ncbi:hypothetical protein SAMN06264364_13247 [Quadrisphaera granulorum]|uniref:Uncharacterized protein n=1 Tax=Quadrisphaera granulorum TaxID=317664 RepID=A0A316AEG8_9ACTN|nr:hypothetical protein [Quadrisphaera granulorum]PWJ48167.1 hypothetical protein BXY45_13247 [Quadrisphaera granulorum]SZE98536.1 hypothetical protein SAMN06264364_13247 [Quadrisphaera granulorum]